MSTIAVARRNGVAAIGADTLTKFGSTDVPAAYLRGDSKILCARENVFAFVGSSAWGLVLRSYLDSLKSVPRLHARLEIFAMLGRMHAELKESYFLNPGDDDDPFESTHLWALLANPHGIFGISGLRCVVEFSHFFAYGAGYDYALGAMHHAFGAGVDAEGTVRAGIAAAAEFDEDTGLPIEVLTMRLAARRVTANGRTA